MKKITITCLLNIFIFCLINAAQADDRIRWDDQIVALPSLFEIESRYLQLENEVEQRYAKYCLIKPFAIWKKNKFIDEIEEEFLKLSQFRGQFWFDITQKEDIERSWREDFRPSLEMMRNGIVRNANCIAFDYNKVSPNYNGSIILINELRFLALEGPLENSKQQFFYTLLDYNVPLLVRLTPTIEQGKERCFFYWKNIANDSQIAIPRHLGKPKIINYLATDNWKDNSSVNADLLLKMVLDAKKIFDPQKGPMAVHCSGGVGRSGTFIAAFCIVNEIDKQINSGIDVEEIQISIEDLVARLSLQRYHMVARTSQYLNLYQIVDKYCEILKEINR